MAFEIPRQERPLQVLDNAVITWLAGALRAWPLDGGAVFDLTDTAGCTPTENSTLVAVGDSVLATCETDGGLAVALFGADGVGEPIQLGLPADADPWMVTAPGGVVVYDSISGITVGLG